MVTCVNALQLNHLLDVMFEEKTSRHVGNTVNTVLVRRKYLLFPLYTPHCSTIIIAIGGGVDRPLRAGGMFPGLASKFIEQDHSSSDGASQSVWCLLHNSAGHEDCSSSNTGNGRNGGPNNYKSISVSFLWGKCRAGRGSRRAARAARGFPRRAARGSLGRTARRSTTRRSATRGNIGWPTRTKVVRVGMMVAWEKDFGRGRERNRFRNDNFRRAT